MKIYKVKSGVGAITQKQSGGICQLLISIEAGLATGRTHGAVAFNCCGGFSNHELVHLLLWTGSWIRTDFLNH